MRYLTTQFSHEPRGPAEPGRTATFFCPGFHTYYIQPWVRVTRFSHGLESRPLLCSWFFLRRDRRNTEAMGVVPWGGRHTNIKNEPPFHYLKQGILPKNLHYGRRAIFTPLFAVSNSQGFLKVAPPARPPARLPAFFSFSFF